MTNEEILNLEVEIHGLEIENLTIGESFDSKRLFGDSGMLDPVYEVLAKNYHE